MNVCKTEAVKGCKWVDEVVTGVPYVMNDEYLKYVIEKYKVQSFFFFF